MNFHQPVQTKKSRSVSLSAGCRRILAGLFVFVMLSAALPPSAAHADWRRRSNDAIELKFLGRYSSGIFGPDAAGSESLAHDPRTQRLLSSTWPTRRSM